MMTQARRKAENITRFYGAMDSLGFTSEQADELRRIEMTLHRWSEAECNGDIEREGENSDGKPRRMYDNGKERKGYRIPDKERGALKRLERIMEGHPGIIAYNQGDPRGVALYLVKKSDIPEGQTVDAYYSRGLAVSY